MISNLFNAYMQSRKNSKFNESDQIEFNYIRNKQDSLSNRNAAWPITKNCINKFWDPLHSKDIKETIIQNIKTKRNILNLIRCIVKIFWASTFIILQLKTK